jgi:hypothetical protein
MPVDIDQRPRSRIAVSNGSRDADQAWAEHSPSALESRTEPPDALDWDAFSAAHFPGGRRHDLAAIVGYAAYRHSLAPASTASARVTSSDHRGTEVDALRGWEDEGGA